MNSTYKRCWANYRADCDRGMSNEHLLSKSLFPDEVVYVSGFEWCKESERCVGINALQRKILCQKHNNDLSPTDTTAKDAIAAFAAGCSERVINGLLLERWLVKTAINLSLGASLHIGHGMTDSRPGWPSPYLLAVAFGDEVLTAKMGAYFLFPEASYSHRAGEIMIVPIHRDGCIGGFVFGLRGVYILLSLYPGHAPPPVHALAPGLLPDRIAAAPLHFRPTSIVVQSHGNATGEVHLQWSGI